MEFGILIPAIPAIPLPERSKKECCLSQETAERKKVNFWFDHKCEKRKNDIKSSFFSREEKIE